jgi:hypothetical protein
MIAIGRVLTTSFAMFRQRFWLLVAMWLVFFAIQTAGSMVLGAAVAVLGIAGAAGLGGGLADPAALTGAGIAAMLFALLLYGAYAAIALAQQAALVVLASPLEQPAFGPALVRGFRSVLPFLGLLVILILAYALFALALGLAAAGTAFAGQPVLEVVAVVLALLLLPVMLYLACRFAVVIPVVAVEQVTHPVAALRRAWRVTRGKVIGVLLTLLATGALGIVVVGAPIGLFIAVIGSSNEPGVLAVVGSIFALLLLLPLFILYSLFVPVVNAVLHAELMGGGAERLEEIFA